MAKRQQRNLAVKGLAERFVSENVPVPELFEKLAAAMEARMGTLSGTEDFAALANDSALLRTLAKEYERKFS